MNLAGESFAGDEDVEVVGLFPDELAELVETSALHVSNTRALRYSEEEADRELSRECQRRGRKRLDEADRQLAERELCDDERDRLSVACDKLREVFGGVPLAEALARATLRWLTEEAEPGNGAIADLLEHHERLSALGAHWRRDEPVVRAALERARARGFTQRELGDLRAGIRAVSKSVADEVAQRRTETALRLRDPHACQLSDLGNAQRLVAAHGHDMRCVPGLGWHVWDGRRFRRDEDGEVERRAKTIPKAIRQEASKEGDLERQKALFSHGVLSEAAPRITAMVRLARSEREVVVAADKLDVDPMLLNTPSGTVDLRTGALRAHDRSDLLTKLTGAAYDADAQCPLWERFLDESMRGDRDAVAFLQRAVGYTLTGSTEEQVFFIAHGEGGNGKSTFAETFREVVGDYAAAADPVTFTTTANTRSARGDVARLRGARYVSAPEMDSGAHLAESLIKQLTGGDRITARFNYHEEFEFPAICKVWVLVNHLPAIDGEGAAMFRRTRVIPFYASIRNPDPRLRSKLRAEAPGILAWAVQGAVEWHANGLGSCAAVEAATATYRREQNRVGAFLDERCTLDPAGRVPTADLYAAYCAWEADQGREPLDLATFARRLGHHGIGTSKSGSTRYRTGLRLTTTETS